MTTKMLSSLGAKLLSCANPAVTTSLMDLNTYVDVTGFESILVVVVSAKLGGGAPETGTNITLTALNSTASDGTGATNVVDRNGSNLLNALGGSAAAGRACSMQIRTRGMKQFFSPGLQATGATVTCCVAVYGIAPRDTAETSAHWLDEAGASVATGTYA